MRTGRVTPVFLPGNMCDTRLWRGGNGVMRDMLARHDLGAPIDADLTKDASIAAMAARALADIEGALLPIGFSLGAIVAVEMWCRAPGRIAGLVLLGYNATADLPDRARHRPVQQAEVLSGGLERILIEELKPNYLAAEHRGDVPMLDLLRDMGLTLGADVFVAQSEALRLREDRRSALSGIDVPVLIGCGDDDDLCPPAWHADWAARMPHATLFMVAGAGHMLPLEQPHALAGHIDRWLTEREIA